MNEFESGSEWNEDCSWVNLREDNKVFESKMAVSESNIAELKMAVNIKLSQNEWVTVLFVQNGWIQDGRVQDGCHYKVESEWRNQSEIFFVQNGWIQDGRIQDGCHHLVNWIELVWVRVWVEWESFWVNVREDNKVFEYKMAVYEFKMARIQDDSHYQVKSEWMSLSQIELVCVRVRWLNPRWQSSRWLPSSSWVRMNEWSLFCAKVGNKSLEVWMSLRGRIRWQNPRWPNSTWQHSKWLPLSS